MYYIRVMRETIAWVLVGIVTKRDVLNISGASKLGMDIFASLKQIKKGAHKNA